MSKVEKSGRLRSARGIVGAAVAALVLVACGGGDTGSAGGPTVRPLAASSGEGGGVDGRLAALRAPEGATAAALPRGMQRANRSVDVWVQLSDAPVSLKKKELEALGLSKDAIKAQLKAQKQALKAKQDGAASTLAGLGATELGRVQVAHNAIAVKVGASRLAEIAALPGVLAVRPVRHYEMVLGETVPYVGGTAAQAAGKKGAGTRVAVLDSGIDYTHAHFGGAGTGPAYAAAYGAAPGDPLQTTRDALFPTPKVVDGFDFVGEAWPLCAPNTDCRTEDPDPIDFQGHGTHVADIIAGTGGMAPDAKLVAVKVCSAVATSCNGIALLKGMDFALDPNGDGDLADAVDVINLSLGSSYGQQEDDLSLAAANAVKIGVSVVASAGNSADRPYILGSPSAAPGVISVAQTQVPSAVAIALQIQSPVGIAGTYRNTATLDWAPIGAGFAGTVKTALAAGGANNLGCAALPAGSLTGFVALVDRGTCNISAKIRNASDAGAAGVLIGLVAAGDAVTFSNGGECPAVPDGTCKPGLVITQATANAIKANLAAAPVVVAVSPAVNTPLVGSMVGSSSRGPGYSDSALKPEIGAPGGSVSAIAGGGTATEAFGGTSGAAPMVAGAAAILRGAFPSRSPTQIKAMLMNSADPAIQTNPATQPGALAPVSRIGSGELRVARALVLNAIAYDEDAATAAVPFGFVEVVDKVDLKRSLTLENFSNSERTYQVAVTYRQAAGGATTIDVPQSVKVGKGGKKKFDVRMAVDASLLPNWALNGGSLGGSGAALQGNEVVGYITLTSNGETLSVPFHALLRKSSDVALKGGGNTKVGKAFTLQNDKKAAGTAVAEIFALTGTSDAVKKQLLPQPGDNFAVVDLKAVGARYAGAIPGLGDIVQFAVSRHDRRAHPAYPAEIDILIDANRDGTDDFAVFTAENGGFAASGQTLVFVANLATNAPPSAFFFLDADLQSGNFIMTVPMAAVGLTLASTFDYSVLAFDNYFTGNLTDAIGPMRYTVSTPRYALAADFAELAPGESAALTPTAPAGGDAASPSQSGFLLLYRQNVKTEAEMVEVKK